MKSSKRRVLVVDDVYANRVLARAYLELLGWDVQECDCPLAALQLIKLRVPGAMLIDILLPEMSGDALARRIRSDPLMNNTRLVAYTAHALEAELVEFMKAGFDQILTKPALLDDFRRAFS